MLDERFARQYRYEPPSEFPLTSPYTGIVHHLSGPKKRAHTQTFPETVMAGRCCKNVASVTFITPVGFSTTRLARVLDSLVRVSRRDGKSHFDMIALSPSGRVTPSTPGVTRKHAGPVRPLVSPDPIMPLSFAQASGLTRTHRAPRRISSYHFRPNDFKSFDPLFKVLFIFPSQYLFAIGLPDIFSLRRSLSPTWCTSIKVHDSSAAHPIALDTTDGALTLFGGPLATTSASRALGLTAYRLQFDGR
jgi:hypothetical protein